MLDEPTRGIDPERKANSAPGSSSTRLRGEACSWRHTTERSRPTAGYDSEPPRCLLSTGALTIGGRTGPRTSGRGRVRSVPAPGPLSIRPAPASRSCLLPRPDRGRGRLARGRPGLGAEVAIVATLGGVAAAGRVLFAAIPGVQPVTVIARGLGERARAARRYRSRRDSGDRLELLPRPGRLDAMADARVGRCGAAGAARALAAQAPAVCRRVLPARFAFSGLMDVWEWFSFYPHTQAALTSRWPVGSPSTWHTPPGTSSSAWRSGRSCAG